MLDSASTFKGLGAEWLIADDFFDCQLFERNRNAMSALVRFQVVAANHATAMISEFKPKVSL